MRLWLARYNRRCSRLAACCPRVGQPIVIPTHTLARRRRSSRRMLPIVISTRRPCARGGGTARSHVPTGRAPCQGRSCVHACSFLGSAPIGRAPCRGRPCVHACSFLGSAPIGRAPCRGRPCVHACSFLGSAPIGRTPCRGRPCVHVCSFLGSAPIGHACIVRSANRSPARRTRARGDTARSPLPIVSSTRRTRARRRHGSRPGVHASTGRRRGGI